MNMDFLDTSIVAGLKAALKEERDQYRYRMTSGEVMVEMPYSVQGHQFLKGLRKGRRDLFLGARIWKVKSKGLTVGVLCNRWTRKPIRKGE